MTTDAKVTEQKFCALTVNDFVLIKVVRRKKAQPTMGQEMIGYFGYGIVLSVDDKGVCLRYLTASGAERDMGGVAETWGIPARLLKDADDFRDAVIERAGVPFMSFEESHAFVMPYIDRDAVILDRETVTT